MQIRQLEALQQMAKSANSKVVFVPMQLQSDVVGQLANQASGSGLVGSEGGESSIGVAGRVGLLNAVSEV